MKETILQFGAGNFLRAFVDVFISQANRHSETALGRIVVVQTTGIERAEALNKAKGRYHVAIQGYSEGQVVDETIEVNSIARALHSTSQWTEVLKVAESADLKWIVSNTTEAGFVLEEADRICPSPEKAPLSFPAKLLAVLSHRFESGQTPLTILPCELIEDNASKLLGLVKEQALRWQLPAETIHWIEFQCLWLNNLVDRIVPGTPKSHPLLNTDPLLLSAEPFAFWAIETTSPFALKDPALTTAGNIRPFYLRKVRVLNGLHTALVAYAMPRGIKTVRECMEDPQIFPWLKSVLFEEIVPALEGQVEDPSGFARTTLDRFRNPFLDHALSSIALNHESKVKVRLKPTMEDYRLRFGKNPPLLSALLSS